MTELYPFQEKGVRKINHFKGRAVLADEMGLGKTAQTWFYIHRYLDKNRVVVIVCPKTIKENWRREAKRHTGINAIILDKMKPPKNKLHLQRGRFFIINYDILGKANKKRGTWLRLLRGLRPQCVVMDECHYAKSLKANRTRSCQELCRGVKKVIALSGTPITSRPAEFWPVLNIVRPDVFPAFLPYAFKFCGAKRNNFGWDFSGSSKPKTLNRLLLRTCMIRRLKRDVMKQLPAKTRTVITVPISRPREYQQAETEFIKWLRTKSKQKALKAAMGAQELVKLGYLKRLAAELKLPALIAWIDDYLQDTDQKLLVFGIHKNVLHALHEHYKKISVLVTGAVTGDKRQRAIDKFNRDRGTRLFFGNIQAAGVGWSCTSTSNVLMAELDWVPGNHSQAEDRVHGIGRGTGAANVYYLIAEGTIEATICRVLEGKAGTLDTILDGKKMNQMSLHKQLEAVYLKRAA